MNITIKCPNCFKQVPRENLFCDYCGYNLAKKPGISDPAAGEVPSPAVTEPFEKPASAYLLRYCPMGHDVADPSLGFCMVCGSPLTDVPPEDPASPGPLEEPFTDSYPDPGPSAIPDPAPAVFTPRKCRCGYLCEDPDMTFCPSCGLPFSGDEEDAPSDDSWVCVCGTRNSSEDAFCTGCGKPKGSGRMPEPESVPEPDPEPATPSIPSGMRRPTVNDLRKK